MITKRNAWFIIVTILFVGCWSVQLVRLNKGYYIVTGKDRVAIDSVKTLTTLFAQSRSKGSRKPNYLTLKDVTDKTFEISVPSGEINQKIYDTLQYTNVVVSIMTSQQGYANYHDNHNTAAIPAHDIIIGNHHLIDIDDINNANRSGIINSLGLTLLAYLICLGIRFHTLNWNDRGSENE